MTTSNGVLENDPDPDLPKPKSLEEVNHDTLINHARQVKRMLTGGMDVIGIYAVAEAEYLKNIQGKLQQTLFAVYKALNKLEVMPSCHWDRILLQISSRTKVLSCRTFNVKDPKSSGDPCELKYQKIADSFLNLTASFTLDSVIPVASENLSYSLQKQMMIGLQPVFDNIWNSLAIVNGSLVEDDSLPICPKSSGEHSRSRGRKIVKEEEQVARLESFDVNFLQEMRLKHEQIPGPEMLYCGAKIHMRGTISSQAYIHSKASTADAVQAVKRDVINSIVARCELLCEDLLQAEEEQDIRVLYETPQRVYVNLPDTNIKLCDYLFQDETLDDSADRFQVLLELDVTSEDVDSAAERLPEESDLVRPKVKVKYRKVRATEVSTIKKSLPIWKYLGFATAAAAAMFSYWLATQDGVV